MSNTADKIRKLSQQAANEKLAEESERAQKRVDQDILVLESILAMVKDRLVYKEVEKPYSYRKVYKVVTEDMVLQDYINPPKYGSGTSIKEVEASYYTYRHTAITVNGHRYHHAADLITKYKHDADTAMKKAEIEYEAAKKRKESIESMEDLEIVMKELMSNFNKHLDREGS